VVGVRSGLGAEGAGQFIKKRHAKAAKSAFDGPLHAATNNACRYSFEGTCWKEISMRRTRALAAALLFFLGGGIAEAAVSTQLAESGGFLLGNAHRCAVPIERIKHAAAVIHDLIAAASYDRTEEAVADSRFVEPFMANAFPDHAGSLVPPCDTVIGQFERLERHHRQFDMN